jgi:HSP20 family protein
MKTLAKTNAHLFPAIPSLLNNFFNDDWVDSSLATWKSANATLPAVNVHETNEDFRIEVAAPGMKKEQFKIELENNVLTISGEHENDQGENHKEVGYTRREFSYQSFQRSFSLPELKVEGEKIAARYADGILYIMVPKREEAKVKPVRKITVA